MAKAERLGFIITETKISEADSQPELDKKNYICMKILCNKVLEIIELQ